MKRIFAGSRPESSKLTPDLLAEIRRSFESAASDEEHFPSTIDPRIYHVKLVLPHLGPLGHGRALDAGCGKGRYARIVKQHNPDATIAAMDLAVSMLGYADPNLARTAGSLLELPFAGESFDGVYATESLEHAVDIPRAVSELCRVLKPGGRLVVIDKNADQWGRLETPHWEKWFRKDELTRLLRRHCRQVEARPISYWEDVEPDGLFLAWLAVK
ncbi:MAG TPA: class I SAM-dependent methyltransferase [Bryobacteraceae bacterium]|nr:class I SAM-dependent methyltransferase [Bryobacteraceae bacterium]